MALKSKCITLLWTSTWMTRKTRRCINSSSIGMQGINNNNAMDWMAV